MVIILDNGLQEDGLQEQRFDTKYDVLGRIGKGAQGEVFKIQDKETGQVYAAKKIIIAKADDFKPLEKEIKALTNLSHPNIANIHGGYQVQDGWGSLQYLIVMDYVDGKSLAEWISQGRRFNESELVRILDGCLSGLEAAHEKGIVHRDVKPSNVMYGDSDSVKLTDFGVAKFLGEETRLSSLGVGTVSYMSPEQFNGKPVTTETDLYSLALTVAATAAGQERSVDMNNIPDPKKDLKKLTYLSSDFRKRLEIMLDENPVNRRGLVQVVDRSIVGADNYKQEEVKQKLYWFAPGLTAGLLTAEVLYFIATQEQSVEKVIGVIVGTTAAAVVTSSILWGRSIRRESKQKEVRQIKSAPESPVVITDSKSRLYLGHNDMGSPQDYIQIKNQEKIVLVSKYKLGMSKEVEAAGKRLGLKLADSAKESNGRDYVGNISWVTAMKLNLALGDFTLGIKDYMAFLQLLKSGEAVDGNGRQIPSAELLAIYNEITEKRDPYRAEWLDADFKVVGSALTMHYNHRVDPKGNLQPRNSETLESHIAENCYADLTPLSKQGLPTKKSKIQEYKQGDNVYFWHPLSDNNSVAGFGADSDRVLLSCIGGPAYSYPVLGVRRAKFSFLKGKFYKGNKQD